MDLMADMTACPASTLSEESMSAVTAPQDAEPLSKVSTLTPANVT